MFISKIPASSKIEIQCVRPGFEPLVFNVEAVLGSTSRDKKPILFCTPIILNEQLVNLKNCSITAFALNRGDHRRYKFNVLDASHVKNPKQEGYLLQLYSEEDARPLNYRRAERIPFTGKGIVQLDGSNVECKMKDISSCGLAFTVPNTFALEKGSNITVSFTSSESSMSYKVNAVVVRSMDVSDTEKLIGCDLLDYYPNLVALCNQLKVSKK